MYEEMKFGMLCATEVNVHPVCRAKDERADDQWPFLVELPGIEPDPINDMTCGNTGLDYAKRRETTCGNASGVDAVNRHTRLGCRCRWP